MNQIVPADGLTLDQLRVFQTVVESGSFSAAARDLGRAQSAVSYAIANLEQMLGLTLFDRSRRRPALTPSGQALLEDAEAIAQHVGRLRARAKLLAGGLEARLSLAVDALFPLPVLLEVLGAFSRQYPEIAVQLYTEGLGAVTQAVRSGTCDVGIGALLDRSPGGLATQPLAPVTMVPVVAADHPLAALPSPVDTTDLQHYPQLVLTDRSALTAGVDRAVVGAGPIWRLADLSTKHACLRAGFGWGNLPGHLARPDLDAGQLARLRVQGWPEAWHHPQHIIFRAADPPGPATRWLLDHLARRCRAEDLD